MSKYDPQEHLASLQEAMTELEEELEDQHLPAAQRSRLQWQRQSLKKEIAQVKKEIEALAADDLFAEAGPSGLTAEVVEARAAYELNARELGDMRRQDPPPDYTVDKFGIRHENTEQLHWIRQQKEKLGMLLKMKIELTERLARTGYAPGQVHEDRSNHPTRGNLGELCLFAAAHGWTLEGIRNLLTVARADALTMEGHTWELYDSIKRTVKDSPNGPPLNAIQMGLSPAPTQADIDAYFAYCDRIGVDRKTAMQALGNPGDTLTWKTLRDAMVALAADEILQLEGEKGGDMPRKKAAVAEPPAVTEDDLFADEPAEELFDDAGTSRTPEEQAMLDEIRAKLGIADAMPLTKEVVTAWLLEKKAVEAKRETLKAEYQGWMAQIDNEEKALDLFAEARNFEQWVEDNAEDGKKSVKLLGGRLQLTTTKPSWVIGDKEKLLGQLLLLANKNPKEAEALKVETYKAVRYTDLDKLKAHAEETGDTFNGGLLHKDEETKLSIVWEKKK